MAFVEDASFYNCGVIFLQLPPSWLFDVLSMDKRDSYDFFSTKLVYRDSDSLYNTTDLSLFLILISSKEPWLRFFFCAADLAQMLAHAYTYVLINIEAVLYIVAGY